MKTLIVGRGEVGTALAEVLDCYSPYVMDKGERAFGAYEILHVCFPYSEEFGRSVAVYRQQYEPKYVVIHSTVPVGTSRSLNAIHSPIRGIHPNLVDGIRTFEKMIGGAKDAAVPDYFRRAGLKIMLFDKPETTEAAKLFETESYRVNIEFMQRVKAFCDEHHLSFHEVYTMQAQSYNAGYLALGHPEYSRPILQPIPGAIGGHCVSANRQLLDEVFA